MGFGGREPFVPQRQLDPGLGLKGVGKVLGLERLGTDVTRHIQRVADHHLGTSILAHQPGQGAKILPPILTHQSEHRLRGEPKLVGDGDADTAIADIEAQNAT